MIRFNFYNPDYSGTTSNGTVKGWKADCQDGENCENDGKKSVLQTFNDVVTIKNLNEIIHSIDLFEGKRN